MYPVGRMTGEERAEFCRFGGLVLAEAGEGAT